MMMKIRQPREHIPLQSLELQTPLGASPSKIVAVPPTGPYRDSAHPDTSSTQC